MKAQMESLSEKEKPNEKELAQNYWRGGFYRGSVAGCRKNGGTCVGGGHKVAV